MKRVFIALVIVILCGTMAACDGVGALSQAPETDPRKGVVRVFPDNNVPSFYKRCDGTTLIYWFEGDRRGGLAAVPDSPECK